MLEATKQNPALSLFISAAFILTTLALALDTIGNPRSVFDRIGTPSYALALIFLLVFVLFRCLSQTALPKKLEKSSLMLGSLMFLFATTLIIAINLTPDNYIYSTTRLNSAQILIVGLFLLAASLINQSKRWWQKNLDKILALFPFSVLLISMLVKLMPFDAFVGFASEDGPIEYFQVAILLATFALSSYQSWQNYKIKNTRKSLVFALLSLGILFVTLEEISWGQRIFDWQTPESLSEINVQNETTIHNIGILNNLQLVGYIFICLAGSLISGLQKLQPKIFRKIPQPPQSAFFLYFIPLVFYVWYVVFNIQIHLWAEVMEVIFYSGVLVWIANLDKIKPLKR